MGTMTLTKNEKFRRLSVREDYADTLKDLFATLAGSYDVDAVAISADDKEQIGRLFMRAEKAWATDDIIGLFVNGHLVGILNCP